MNFFGIFRAKKTLAPSKTPAPSEGSGGGANRKKILIVDDNPVVLSALSAKLKARGYAPLTATDGSEAIRIVRQSKPDLILLDLGFPPDVAGGGVPWDGFRIIEWLSRMEEGKNIPIIIITGSQNPQDKERSLEAGAMAFFLKPVEGNSLLSVIGEAIGEKSE